MAAHIHKCIECSNYTFGEKCSCGGEAIQPKPPKFSLDDKYGKYRRKVKKVELREKNLI